MRKKIVLIVEDDQETLKLETFILENAGYRVFGVNSIASANQAVASSLRSAWFKFDIIIADLNLSGESGEEFARRSADILGANVLIVTGDVNAATNLSFKPDDIIIKPLNMHTLLEMTKRLSTPLHKNKLKKDVKLNLWLATQELKGFSELKPFSRHFSGEKGSVEKIYGLTKDKREISCVIYPEALKTDQAKKAGISSLIGCPVNCDYCRHPVSRFDDKGCLVTFLRKLTEGEMLGQIYLIMTSPMMAEVFRDKSAKKLIINFTCEGEGFCYNFENVMAVTRKLSKIIKPRVEVIITTTGSEALFKRYREGYADLPVTFYYSLVYPDSESRETHMEGTSGHSIENELRELELIAELLGSPQTVAITDFRGTNDSASDIEKFSALLGGLSPTLLKVKIQPGASGTYGATTTPKDARKMRTRLIKAGVTQDIRLRNVEGDENSGCGRTGPHWPCV